MSDPALIALGATILTCALAVAGLHAYASGRAQRQALVDRLDGLSGAGPHGGASGRVRRFATVDRRLRRTRLGRAIHLRLSATGLDLTAGSSSRTYSPWSSPSG